MSRVDDRIAEWMRRLVDLTRRNRLLFFKQTRSTSLRVTEPSFEKVFHRLVVEEDPWNFFIPPDESEEVGSKIVDPVIQTNVDSKEPQEQPPLFEREPDELLTSITDPRRLLTILRNLYRRSRSDFAERGVRILHVAFGMLEWREFREGEVTRSPLLLVPAEIERDSANDPFMISTTEEDIIINPALQVKLRNDFRLELPPLPDDMDDSGLHSYLAAVKHCVRGQGWAVQRECWIGLFSFHKLVMYQDLNNNAEIIKRHLLVQALAEGSAVGTVGEGGDVPDPKDLDNLIQPEKSYLVADADSSQLACIEAVKRNTNLLIQGPPGTGKSQTITNLIAESIAAGRKVLFVSEKMAALEVVYNRVLAANLGHYCLELHSHKADKKKVVETLYKSYRESLQPRTVMTDLEFQQLADRRRKLNEYVNALHLVRDPLGKSAYMILGELAELERVPFISSGDVQVNSLDPARFDGAIQLAKKLAHVWKVVIEGEAFPWRGCTITSFGLDTRTLFQSLIGACENTFANLMEEDKQIGKMLGFTKSTRFEDCKWLLRAGEILKEGAGIDPAWITTPRFDVLARESHKYLDFSSRRLAAIEDLGQRYTEGFFQIAGTLKQALTAEIHDVSSHLMRNISDEPLWASQGDTVCRKLAELTELLEDCNHRADSVCKFLDLRPEHSVSAIRRFVQTAELCGSGDRPERSWLDPVRLGEVRETLPEIRRDHEARAAALTEFLQEYDEPFLALDLDTFISNLSTRYVSPLRWLKPGFYRLRRQVRRWRKDGRTPPNIMNDLRRARDLVRLEAKIRSDSERTAGLLGSWYRGYRTNFARLENAVEVAGELLGILGTDLPKSVITRACLGSVPSVELQEMAGQLKGVLEKCELELAGLSRLLQLERLPSSRVSLYESPFEDVITWLKSLTVPLSAAVTHIKAMDSLTRSRNERKPSEILSDLEALSDLRELESQMLSESEHLRATYGNRFVGLDTNWEDIINTIRWAERLMVHLGQKTPPEPLLAITRKGETAVPDLSPLRDRMREFQEAFSRLAAQFDPPYPQVDGCPLSDGDFNLLGQRLLAMRDRIDEVREWAEYKRIESDFREADLYTLHTEIVQKPSIRPEDIPDIVRRALLSAWVNWLSQQDPVLRQFQGEYHEALIAEFRDLDRKQFQFGSHRVIKEAERRRPRGQLIQPGGEAAVLFREANKERRLLPIRRLFSEIPNLLTSLKPCLLMSPLSVSQFLNPEQSNFDLVIFDEASQICSEDAVGAIYRGRKLVVCGDKQQLPPTAFFEQGMSDEYEDQDAAEAFDFFPSILAELESIGLAQGWLRWHYRSRHESLINFSNQRFYDHRLVTFPASRQEHPTLGIHFIYVPDGVYDRGGRRDNQREAEIIVDLVVEHFQKYPDRTLGVVAFSVAQMNAIEDRKESVLRDRPELERFFVTDRLHGFFVKNLENVQGDERDVMIFSIGYGKDQHGRLTMNFGPLNFAGGERRLNVAVTRARDKVIVVSSIRAADLDLAATDAPGVRALYHYLDYAERGPEALELTDPRSSGEFDSPLEREVAGAIRTLGYDVVPQVGCSGYRIDLGVIDPAEPGRFVLGVECDGANYHSAAVARDRDRLRQEVLENLGWRIHRVWSPEWIIRRETAMRRLREAIEQARASSGKEGGSTTRRVKPEAATAPIVTKSESPSVRDLSTLPRWTVPYRLCSVKTRPAPSVEFHDPSARRVLLLMMQEVIDVEGPVHLEVLLRRLAERWGLQKSGRRMKDTVKKTLGVLLKEGEAEKRGHFVWPKTNKFSLKVRRPDQDDSATIRKVEFIPDEELELAIKNIVRDALSISREDILTQVARVFGFDRTGHRIRRRLERILGLMIQHGTLVEKEARLSLKQEG